MAGGDREDAETHETAPWNSPWAESIVSELEIQRLNFPFNKLLKTFLRLGHRGEAVYEFGPGSVAALAGDLLTSCQCRKTILADSEKARQYDPAEARRRPRAAYQRFGSI